MAGAFVTVGAGPATVNPGSARPVAALVNAGLSDGAAGVRLISSGACCAGVLAGPAGALRLIGDAGCWALSGAGLPAIGVVATGGFRNEWLDAVIVVSMGSSSVRDSISVLTNGSAI